MGTLVLLRTTTNVFALTDIEPPTTPTNLRISMTTPNSVSLSWNASTDNVAVAYYNVYKNGVISKQETTLTSTFYNLPAGSVVFNVKSVDTSNNQSGYSNSIFYLSRGTTGPTPTATPTLIPSGTQPTPSGTLPTNTPTPTFTPSPTMTPTNTPTPTFIPSPTMTPTNTPTPTPTPDQMGPSVLITYPINNAIVNKNSYIIIRANVSDISGVSKVMFYVNNVLKCTDTTSAYSCDWRVPTTKNATHTLKVVGYDTLGNTTTSSIQVRTN